MKVDHYLVFGNGEHFLSKRLKEDFQHILILAFDGFNWIMMEPALCHFKWWILPVSLEDDPFNALEGQVILKMNPPKADKKWFLRPNFLSCVLFAKYYFGIKGWVFTPYQLYRYILKNKLGEEYGW